MNQEYVIYDGKKLSFGYISRCFLNDKPITIETLKESFIWKKVETQEKDRLTQYFSDMANRSVE